MTVTDREQLTRQAIATILNADATMRTLCRLLLGAEYASHGLIFAATFGEPLWWGNIVTRHFAPTLARTALRLASLTLPEAPPEGARRAVRRAWTKDCAVVEEKALEKTGLLRMRPYDLRHSAATLLL